MTRRLPLLLTALLFTAQAASCFTDNAVRTTTWHYDRAGRAFALDLANGQRQENTYDSRGLLTSRTLKTTAGAVIAGFAWTHDDASGNVLGQSETWPGSPERATGTRLTEMSYHPGGQLHLETVTAPGEAVRTAAYEYDGALNRSAKVVRVILRDRQFIQKFALARNDQVSNVLTNIYSSRDETVAHPRNRPQLLPRNFPGR